MFAEGSLAAGTDLALRTRRRVRDAAEMGLYLPVTQQIILDALSFLPGADIEVGREASWVVLRLPGTGVHADDDAYVLLRADIDALPLGPSGEGLHACGHDVHTAILVGLAAVVSASPNRRPFLLVFQPGEEGYAGAEITLEESILLNTHKVRKAFALHVDPQSAVGTTATRAGSFMSGFVEWDVEFLGRGGHAAFPEKVSNPLVPANLLFQTLPHVRNAFASSDDILINCVLPADAAKVNVIPEVAHARISVRAHDADLIDRARLAVYRVVDGLAYAFGCTQRTSVVANYYPLVNDDDAVEAAESAIPGLRRLPNPLPASEDFSCFVRRFGGAMVLIGAASDVDDPGSLAPCHTPAAVFDDRAVEHGIGVLLALAESAR